MLQTGGVWLVAGLLVGAVLAWIVARSRGAAAAGAAQAAAVAATQRAETLAAENTAKERALEVERSKTSALGQEVARLEERVDAEKKALEQARATLKETFGDAAADALRRNNQAFLDLAKERLGAQQAEAEKALETKQTAIGTLLKPVGEALSRLQSDTQELERQRAEAYGAVLAEIRNLQQAHGDLRRETSQLIQALKAPKTRGSWGELQLRKCIEFAGMIEHCTFEKEVHIAGTPENEDALRPDVVVHLPNSRCIVVDAKTPLEAFMDAMATEDDALKAEKLKTHALQVRKHLEQLQKKRYWERLEHAADFVVCFLPSEVLFSAALEADPTLIEFGVKDNVVLATPTTLISLLRAVAIGWQQTQLTENARSIQETGLALYKKLGKAHEHMTNVGKGIRNAGKAYDDLVSIFEGRGGVFSQARKLRELGVGDSEIEAVDLLSVEPRELRADDWTPASQGFRLAASSEDAENGKQS
jgi:DNA recombination protein RmuC